MKAAVKRLAPVAALDMMRRLNDERGIRTAPAEQFDLSALRHAAPIVYREVGPALFQDGQIFWGPWLGMHRGRQSPAAVLAASFWMDAIPLA